MRQDEDARGQDDPGAAPRTIRPAHTIRLPGFVDVDQEVGLGDVIKRATSRAGINPCAGCRRRAAALNRWMTFTRSPRGGAR